MPTKLTIVEPKPTSPPPQSNSAGSRLWRKILRERALTAAQLELLKRACIAVDDADALRTQVEESGAVFYRPDGSPAVHPGVGAELRLRRFVAKTLGDIGLLRGASEPKRSPGRPPSEYCGITYEQLQRDKRDD